MENEILENGKYVVITSKFNCQEFPLGTYETYTTTNEDGIEESHKEFVPFPHLIFVSYEDLKAIEDGTKCFDLENNCVIDYDNTEDKKLERLQELRALREPLLIAFDKYKSNVNYGVEIETLEQRNIIIKWYNEIKNLNENYIIKDENIPKRIKYYL